jgi:hypothetical protein
LENTGDKKTSRNGAMRNGGIREHRGQRNRQGCTEMRDWRTQGTKKQARVHGDEGLENTGDKETGKVARR